MLELDGSQSKALRLGLQSAFSDFGDFDVFLREELDKRLNLYAGAGDAFPVAVFKLIDGAQAEGWVDALVTKAYHARPRNRNIATIATIFGTSVDCSKLEPPGPDLDSPPLWQSLNPYRGLLALREQDANFLFGRDDDVERFVATLAENPSRMFLALGASGVGKSSLIVAGVFAALDRQSLRGDKPWPARLSRSQTWPRLTLTPGAESVRSLAGAFVRQWLPPIEAKFQQETGLWRDLLVNGDRLDGLIEALDAFLVSEKGDKPGRYVLYIDQGEELYTRSQREPNQDNTKKETQAQKEARRFSELIAEAARHPRIVPIMSARSDFLGRLQADAPLHAVKQQIDIAPLSPVGLSEVVRRPAAMLGVAFEPGLDEALVAGTREQVGGLPLLSDTLDVLWKEMQERRDGRLRWTRPVESVDVASKLGERADGFVKAHQHQEALLRRLFCVYLAYVPPQGAATRRRAFLTELTDPERALVAELSGPDQRIVVAGEHDGKATAEVAHEALFTAWHTLRNWLATRRAFYAWVTQIEVDRQDYEKQGALLTGRPLERAKSFLETDGEDVPAASRAFIEASIRADDRRRRFRVGLIALAVVILVGTTAWALMQRNEAFEQRANAERQRDLALFSVDSTKRIVGPISGQLMTLADRTLSAADSGTPLMQAEAYLSFAQYHFTAGDLQRANQTMELAQRIFNSMPASESGRYGSFKARTEELKGDIASFDGRTFSNAEEAFNSALKEVEKLEEPSSAKALSQVRLFGKLGKLAIMQGDFTKAEQLLENGSALMPDDEPAFLYEAAAYKALQGEILDRRGLRTEAISRFMQSKQLFTKLTANSRRDNPVILHFAQILQRLGDSERAGGDSNAASDYEQSINLLRKLQDDDQTLTDATKGLDFAYHGIRLLQLSDQAKNKMRYDKDQIAHHIDDIFGLGIGNFHFGMTPTEINALLKNPYQLTDDDSKLAGDDGFWHMRYFFRWLSDEPDFQPFSFLSECLRKSGYVVFQFHEHRLLRITVRFLVDRGACPARDNAVDTFAAEFGLNATGAANERRIKYETDNVALDVISKSSDVNFDFTQR
jgi:tetratricopeptide (TPR) repeat protein